MSLCIGKYLSRPAAPFRFGDRSRALTRWGDFIGDRANG
jgi:hypothetical protein